VSGICKLKPKKQNTKNLKNPIPCKRNLGFYQPCVDGDGCVDDEQHDKALLQKEGDQQHR